MFEANAGFLSDILELDNRAIVALVTFRTGRWRPTLCHALRIDDLRKQSS
jgi:hypothetical protein